MDYLEIIIQGYFNENNREFLNKYFSREFEKAKKENYSALEFFKGCEKVINNWETYLSRKISERKRELYLLLADAQTNKRKKSIEDFQNQLKDIRPDGIGDLTYTIHLSSLTNNRIAYNMNYSELLVIKKALYEVALNNYIDILNNQPAVITEIEKTDTRYRFSPYLEELRQRENSYELYTTLFGMHGFQEIDNAKVYNIDLCILFQYKDVKLHNTETEIPEIVNGKDYLCTYLEGYKKGESEINTNEAIIYGANADAYILDIHNNYFHNKLSNSWNGWNYVRKVNIHSFTHKEIYDYGYYSGIINKVDEMAKKYSKQFQKFEICKHELQENSNDFNFFKLGKTESYNGVRFLIENETGNKREYTPYNYLDYTLETALEQCEKSDNSKEKILMIKQVQSKIFDYINRYNLFGCDKVLETCKMKIDLLELELQIKEPQPNNENKQPPKGFEKIFNENIKVWNLFTKLVEVIVESKKKKDWYAQFSVIFQTLIETKVIPKNRHRLYLDFCDDNYGTDFKHHTKLKTNTSNHSTELIKSYLKGAELIK